VVVLNGIGKNIGFAFSVFLRVLLGSDKNSFSCQGTGTWYPDIRTSGFEQAICYAAILINYAKESQQEFDELLIEKNRYGAIWLHFAVRPKDNRHKVAFLQA
jgi:hypothetical protein